MQDRESYTQRLMEVSDQIAEVGRRNVQRAKTGQPKDEADEKLLAELTAELNRPRTATASENF